PLPPMSISLWSESPRPRASYFNGQIFGMGGASPRHVLIVSNLVGELGSQLKGRPCSAFSTDLRVLVNTTGLYTYPDIVVVCDGLKFRDDIKDTVTNPTLIIEVLSKPTKDYDRGEKFEHYRTIESFKEYVLVAQDKHHVEHHLRQPDNTWLLSETSDIKGEIELTTIDCRLALSEIYDKVDELTAG
ncbi:MAG: Uma2 family endonuclease, partial [Blastocatellia bacterium]